MKSALAELSNAQRSVTELMSLLKILLFVIKIPF
jgi:hypothetical protein